MVIIIIKIIMIDIIKKKTYIFQKDIKQFLKEKLRT